MAVEDPIELRLPLVLGQSELVDIFLRFVWVHENYAIMGDPSAR